MVSQPQAARGRTVFGSGSYAPTRGPVSGRGVQGYLQRSVRQGQGQGQRQGPWGGSSNWGGDGKSDTRSGVAQRAMQNRGGWGGNDWKSHYPGGGQQGGGGQQQSGNGPEAGGMLPQNTVGQAPPSVATPTIVVGDAGKLELPYDPSMGQDVYEALAGSNEEIAGIGRQEQAQAAMYAQQQHLQGQKYAGQQVATLNRGGASGNLFSSGQGMAVAADATSNQNTLNSLAGENTQVMTDLNTQRTGIQNAFRQFLGNRSLQYADELSEDAGELGYGESAPEFPEDTSIRLPKGGKKGKGNKAGSRGKSQPPEPPKHQPPRAPGHSPPHRPPRPGKRK